MKNQIKAIIIDDEYMSRELLKHALSDLSLDIMVVETADTVDKAIKLINQIQPEIVFLDIQMTGESGFELFEKIDNINFEVIFVTGFNDYMMEAFKVSAVGYVLKPINPIDLKAAVKNAEKRLLEKQFANRYKIFIENTQLVGTDKMKLVLSTKDGLSYIEIKCIIRCEGWEKYTYIYCVDNKKYLSTKNIGHYKSILEPLGFFTTHKSHLINLDHFLSVNIDDGLLMKDGSLVPLARRRKKLFQETIDHSSL